MNDSIIDETNYSDHIERHLGPQQALPLTWLIPLTVIYLVILMSGLIGNLITILVVFRFRYMQTITNLYLCNLAITDLISLMFSLPLELYSLWHQYPWQLGGIMCQLKTLVLEGTANASVLTLVAFTVERFLAICGSSNSMPPSQCIFNPKSVSRIKRIACRNIAFIWMISLCGAAPLVTLTRINYLEYQSEPLMQSAWCGLPYNEPDKRWELVMLSSTIAFFLIPLAVISCLYYQIARKLKQATLLDSFTHSDIHLTDHATSRKIVQSRKIVIRMLGMNLFF
ncbi:hypothetical protein RDWZM_009233 [Blomia tropicalis]|uniref:G-protein coupled receptors family 1 profile domain-containing protein n=1 Tax=Blomia tropicalis TaxID=40697 RepID=A0A9Q0RKV4_BLOTA|nr:hypothetical protein RDWZM_009233 [Blomia tropicalis]